jgi:predicted  nucleic acid-binding Zn-ribbon protein
MWTKVVDLARLLFTFSEGLQQNRADIKELQRELRDLTSRVQQLSNEIRRVAENEAHEREKLGLRLENELLKFERRLPGNQPKEISI